jgi:hypothetical protein
MSCVVITLPLHDVIRLPHLLMNFIFLANYLLINSDRLCISLLQLNLIKGSYLLWQIDQLLLICDIDQHSLARILNLTIVSIALGHRLDVLLGNLSIDGFVRALRLSFYDLMRFQYESRSLLLI